MVAHYYSRQLNAMGFCWRDVDSIFGFGTDHFIMSGHYLEGAGP